MGAFDKIQSGIPGLDEALDCIRLGDNVVWQISDLEEFRMFAEPFARQAVAEGRNVTYIRFAQHEPVLRDLRGIQMCRFDPDEGFEPFTVAIHEEITRQGRGAFYVFAQFASTELPAPLIRNGQSVEENWADWINELFN